MNYKISLTIIMISLILSGCNGQVTGHTVKAETVKFANETFPFEVAKLPEIDINNDNTFENYKELADNLNTLIEILNRQTEYNIPLFPTTREVWSKVSTTITKYGPLVNNYNEVIRSAKEYDSSRTQETKKEFYIATGRFGFEASLIIWAVLYSAAYESVGIVYRSIGLNKLAFEHPIIVKTILSNWHWILRNTLVETASQTATNVFNGTLDWYNEIGEIESINKQASNLINISSKKINSIFS